MTAGLFTFIMNYLSGFELVINRTEPMKVYIQTRGEFIKEKHKNDKFSRVYRSIDTNLRGMNLTEDQADQLKALINICIDRIPPRS